MKNIFILILSLLSYSTVFAEQNTVMCPATLTCNYEAGTCELPVGKWAINYGYAEEPFSNSIPLNLVEISAFKKELPNSDDYEFNCTYWSDHSSGIIITTRVKNLGGDNWTINGFGKSNAYCNNQSYTNCYGVN